MTTEELRIKLQEAKDPNWFNTIQFRFYNSKSEFNLSLLGIVPIYEYVSKQAEGWSSLSQPLSPNFETTKKRTVNLKSQLISFIQNGVNLDQNGLAGQWNNNIINSHNGEHIPYESAEAAFVINLQTKFPQYSNAAFEFLLGKQDFSAQVNTKNSFIGSLMAYEFLTKDSSEILSRKNAEGSAVLSIKKDFANYLSNSEKQISELFKEVHIRKEEDIKSFDDLRTEKEKAFNDWHEQSRIEFEQFKKSTAEEIEGIKKTYNELLRLQEPAEYWNKRAQQLKKEGRISLGILIGLIVLGAACLYFILWQTPEGMLKSFFNEDRSLALRWSIVFVAFISLLFIGIKVVSKVMFSSFHLARDAEERQQLTYVYLSLRKDSAVDEKDKQLIMQSLFSRADTGLLKEDSSPTMPGGIDKIIKS